MHTVGFIDPDTIEDARDYYSRIEPTARTIVRETAKAMDFDSEEYRDRVTPAVIEHAREALFASFLAVTVGTRAEFDTFVEDYSGEVVTVGSEHVDHVAWHTAPFANTTVAATFHGEEAAAVETLRRQAFGRIYRDHLG